MTIPQLEQLPKSELIPAVVLELVDAKKRLLLAQTRVETLERIYRDAMKPQVLPSARRLA